MFLLFTYYLSLKLTIAKVQMKKPYYTALEEKSKPLWTQPCEHAVLPDRYVNISDYYCSQAGVL